MKKLDLDKLKVQSFVTSISNKNKQTMKGGDSRGNNTVCRGPKCFQKCTDFNSGPKTGYDGPGGCL